MNNREFCVQIGVFFTIFFLISDKFYGKIMVNIFKKSKKNKVIQQPLKSREKSR